MTMRVADSQSYLTNDAERGSCWGKKSGLEQKLILFSGLLGAVCLALIISLAVVVNNNKDSGTTTAATSPTLPPTSPASQGTDATTSSTGQGTDATTSSTGQRTDITTSGTLTTGSDTTTTYGPDVCTSSECRGAAMYYMANMNLNANPCDDFYKYVCGGWEEESEIPDHKGRWGVFDELRDQLANTSIDQLDRIIVDDPKDAFYNARQLFHSCVATELTTEDDAKNQIKQILKNLDGSDSIISVDASSQYYASSDPDSTDTTIPSDDSWLKLLSSISNEFGKSFLINVYVGADVKDTTQNVIYIDQPASFPAGRLSLLLNDTLIWDDHKIDAYKTYITQTACVLDTTFCAALPRSQVEAVQSIIEFESEVAKKTSSPADRRNADALYNKMTIDELQNNITDIYWLEFIQAIFKGSKETIENNTVVIVREPAYLRQLAEICRKFKGVVNNYLRTRIVQSVAPSLCKQFRDIEFEFDKVVSGVKKQVDIKERCFELVNGYFGHVVGRLYVDAVGFTSDTKKDMEHMVEKIADSFRTLVDENDWMDNATKLAAKEKLEVMNDKIGYPDWTMDNEKLEAHYKLRQPLTEKFFPNLQEVLRFTIDQRLAKLSKTNNRSEDWVSSASIVNAFYSPSGNGITFPAGILQVPFYQEKRLKALNYGGIGYVIGHEITHGYDDSGSQYDQNGNLQNWWSAETLKQFNQRKECFINQYSNITDKQTELNLKGEQVIGENIADNGGIREAYEAYINSDREDLKLPGMEDINDKQLFFIAAGSLWCTKYRTESLVEQILYGVHSPGRYRATIPLKNTRRFAEAFNCPLDSEMNPKDADRCVIW